MRAVHAGDGCADRACRVIGELLRPVRFADRSEEFEARFAILTVTVAFAGLEDRPNREFPPTEPASSLVVAEAHAQTVQSKLNRRRVRPEVLKYCESELLQDNSVHAVFGATKGLAQRIRDLAGSDLDGTQLVDAIFLGMHPRLAFHVLGTETERGERRGYAALLKG